MPLRAEAHIDGERDLLVHGKYADCSNVVMSKRNYRANAEHAAAMIRRISAVVDRLAARGIEVFSLDWSSIGWSLVVGWNEIAVKFDSSTRDGNVTVEESPVRELTFPNEWVETQRKVLGKGKQQKILQFVEKYLEDRFE